MEPSDDAEGRRPGPTGWAAHAAPAGSRSSFMGICFLGPLRVGRQGEGADFPADV